MASLSVNAKTNNSEYKQCGLLDIDKLLTETQNESDININEEMLILQNGATFDVSSKNYYNIKSSSTSNLYVDVTNNHVNRFIKKEKVSPVISEKNSDVKEGGPSIFSGCEMIAPDLKREPNFINSGEDNVNNLLNHKGIHKLGNPVKRKVNIKQEIINSDDDSIAVETENRSNNDFIENKIRKDSVDCTENMCSDGAEIASDMDEDGNSIFNERMSVSEEDVNSSDIEKMFCEEEIKKKKTTKKNEKVQPLKCSTCGKSFKLERNLQKHILSHSNDASEEVRKFECDVCGNKFKKKQHLQRHKLSHTQEKKFSCSHCEKSYYDKHDLKKHLLSIHTVKKCNVCGVECENNTELKKHQAIHKETRCESLELTCNICHKKFRKIKYLKRHLQVHAKVTPFACKDCDKSFLYPFLLQEHSRSHTGEKPFSCDKCDMKFSTKSNLVRHASTHLRKKICNNCCSEFEDAEQYKEHKLSCILKYECAKCGWICERMSNMRRHVKTHSKYSNPDDSLNSSESENIFVRIA